MSAPVASVAHNLIILSGATKGETLVELADFCRAGQFCIGASLLSHNIGHNTFQCSIFLLEKSRHKRCLAMAVSSHRWKHGGWAERTYVWGNSCRLNECSANNYWRCMGIWKETTNKLHVNVGFLVIIPYLIIFLVDERYKWWSLEAKPIYCTWVIWLFVVHFCLFISLSKMPRTKQWAFRPVMMKCVSR